MANPLVQLAFDHHLRAEQIIHLGTMACCDPMADIAQEAFEDDWEQIRSALQINPPDLDRETIAEHLMLSDRLGFLVQIGMPVPHRFTEGGGYLHYGFGHYHCRWFYGETIEQVFEKAAKYQTEYVERKRAEAEAKEATSC
jgi:uncharacterized protein YodC (DUF2158 family)